MIENFKDWSLNEEYRRHRVWGISGYRIKEYDDDGSIGFEQKHPNMGLVQWFTIDKNSQFHTKTRATEEFVLDKMMEILNPPKPVTKAAEDYKRIFIDFIEEHPTFKKWLERGKRNIKFGL